MNTPVSISNDLKLAAKSPKVYLTNFFSELKNQIDLECEAYLSRSDLQVDQQDRAIFQQLQLIHEVNYFEKKCLANVEQIQLPTNEQTDALKTEKELYCVFYQLQKQLFRNQGIVFMNSETFDRFLQCNLPFNLHRVEYKNPQQLFGQLFIIEDEFLVLNKTTRKMLSKKIIFNDWCNESLRIIRMSHNFRSQDHIEESTSSIIHRIQLDMSHQNSLCLKAIHFNTVMLNQWKLNLPSLRNISFIGCHLNRIEPGIFNGLPNLEDLRLSNNELVELENNLFWQLSALRRLYLNGNKFASLDRNLFKGLTMLNDLILSNNLLVSIPVGLFNGLVNLKHLNLNGNRIDLDYKTASVFIGCFNLKVLDLGNNLISSIPDGSFQNLTSLESLYLVGNQITELQDNCFLKEIKTLKRFYG